jgi:hypothetical protein
MSLSGVRRAGLVFGGTVLGLFGFAIGLWFYLQAARVTEVRTAIGERLRLALDAIEHVQVVEERAIRFSLRDVALLDEFGDTILAAPRIWMTLDMASLDGEGAIEFYDVELIEPFARIIREPDGDWNYLRALNLTVGGQPVAREPGRPLLFHDVRLVDGRLVLAIPAAAPADPGERFAVNLPIGQVGGERYQVYSVSDIQGRLARVRIGGADGWRADVASLSGQVAEPNVRIVELVGWAEQAGEDGVEFDVEALRIGESLLAGGGLVRILPDGFLYAVEIAADPVRMADIRPIFPNLPEEGVARFAGSIESLTLERVAIDLRQLEVTALDSRLAGRIGFAAGGDVGFSLLEADLVLDPLRLLALEQLGLVEETPFLGDVRGRISTVGAAPGFATVDLAAAMVPRGEPEMPVSEVLAQGSVAIGDAAEALRFDGLTLGLQPLHVAALRGLVEVDPELLRGVVRGSVLLGGTTDDLRFTGGELAYTVGAAPPTRLVGLTGRIVFAPELAYELSAVAQPLAFATLTELFPALPLRATTLTGPLQIAGGTAGARLSADLTGPGGGIRFAGSVAFDEPARFDLEGSLRAFVAGMLLRPDVPVEGPLTGTFAVRGTTERFEFDVDLTQLDGRFALRGSVEPGVEPPRFDVRGNLYEFRVGALIGEPQLFPDPMTGPIAVAGGGGDPYHFEIDLVGQLGRLDLAGFYLPGPVPVYEARGVVAGLDLARFPFGPELPPTTLTGTVDIRGRGADTETLEGSLAFDFTASSVAGRPLDAAIGRVEAAAGVLFVDTLHVQLERTVLRASGSWGLTAPAPEPLRYSFVSPDLSVLTRIVTPGEMLPPPLTGSVESEGVVAGSFEYPTIAGWLRGRNLRYGDWRAVALSMNLDAERRPALGWAGQLALDGEAIVLPGVETFQTVRLEASGTEAALAVGLFARRDAASDLSLSGLLEMEGLRPRGIGLESLALRLDPVVWELLQPARLRAHPETGLLIENLVLERRGPTTGLLTINGVLPPTGAADFRISASAFDLSDLHRITPRAPALEGTLDLQAVLEGPLEDPELSIEAWIDQLRVEGVLTETLTFDGLYSGQRLTGSGEATMEGQRLLLAEVDIPMLLSLEQVTPSVTLLRAAPASMTLLADSLPLDLVAAMVAGLTDGTGIARAQIEMTGTLDAPQLSGWARLAGGAVTVEPLGARYSGIDADIELVQNRALVRNLSARSGGTAVVSGTIDFPPGGPPRLVLTSAFDSFRLMDDPAVARLTISGQLGLDGPSTGPVLTGRIEVRESTIRVPEFAEPQPTVELEFLEVGQIGTLPDEEFISGPPLFGNLMLDGVELSIAEAVWLESNEMRVQVTGDLILYRTGDELRIFGAAQAVRGTYALEISAIVREFDIIRGRVQFFGTGDLNPAVDILAGYRVRGTTVGRGGDLTILVHVTGTLLAPRVQLTSDTPVPLSEADLISYLLFGQPSFELGGVTRTFAEQILVQEIFGGLLATELERPILAAGICDWVRVRPGLATTFRGLFGAGPLAGAVIECGWELAADLFLTGQTGIGGLFGGEFADWRVGLEWQIDDQWMWEASYGAVQRGPLMRIFDPVRRFQFSTDLRRQWEYGRPRQRTLIDLLPDDPLETEMPPIPGAPGLLDPM